MSLTPKNWADFQHYKDRSPVWIKLHRSILDNYEYHCLPVASRALAPMLWLLASEYEAGKITASVDAIAFRLRMPATELADALKPLIDSGFFIDDSNVLAACYQAAIPEKETQEKTEKDYEPDGSLSEQRSDVGEVEKKTRKKTKYPDDFETFWKSYPTDSNMSKAEGFSEWKKLSPEDKADAVASVPGFCAYCDANKDYRPIHANRYLKKRRFEGHLAKAKEVANWCEVRISDPNWNAWLAYYRDGGRKFMAKIMQEKGDRGEPFRVPHTWPDGMKENAA